MSPRLPSGARPAILAAGLAFALPFAFAASRAEASPGPCLSVLTEQPAVIQARLGDTGGTVVGLYNACDRRITIEEFVGSPSAFSVPVAAPLKIPARSWYSLPVNFVPAALGTVDGTVRIRTGAASRGVLTVTLRGEGVLPPTFTVNPSSLEATVPAGTTASVFLDFTNSGGEWLEAITDPTGPALLRPAAGWKVLYLNSVIPGTAGDDFTRALSARAGIDTVETFDGAAATPTLPQLLAYDVVMVNGSAPWADPASLGMVVADYLHAGGKLAILAGALASGPGMLPYDAGAYFTFHAGMALSSGGQSASYQTHPITDGLGVFGSSLVVPSSSIGGQGMGRALGYYDNGHLIGAVHPSMPVVCLNVHPVDGGWSGDLVAFVGNTVDYLGGMMNWLTFTKSWPNDNIFVVSGNSSRTMELKVHTYRMAPGTYQGRVDLIHSDPNAPNPMSIPVTLTVTP